MRIGMFGSVGYNIGDEAIAVTVAKTLVSYDPSSKVFIGSIRQGAIGDYYKDLNEFYIDRKSVKGWISLINFIKSLDLVVIGGGTMIQDKLGISITRGMIPYIAQIIFLSKIYRKKVVSIPIGVDNLNTNKGKRMAKYIINQFDKMLVRDAKSKELALQYAPKAKNIIVSSDPAFNLERFIDKEFRTNECTGKYVVVSLVNENISKENYFGALIKTIETLVNEENYEIVLIPMDRRHEEELTIFEDLQSILNVNRDRIHIVHSDKNSMEMTDILRKADLLIAMRLHAMILGVGHTPIVGLSRTTKTETFLNEFKLPSFDINKPISDNELSKLVLELIREEEPSVVDQLRIKETKQQKLTDDIISVLS